MIAAPKKTAPGAQAPRAEESVPGHYPAALDFTAESLIESLHNAQRQLRNAGAWLVRGDLPACVGAIEVGRKALGDALQVLAVLMGSA